MNGISFGTPMVTFGAKKLKPKVEPKGVNKKPESSPPPKKVDSFEVDPLETENYLDDSDLSNLGFEPGSFDTD